MTKGLPGLYFRKRNHQAFQVRSQKLLRSAMDAECCLGNCLGSIFVEGHKYIVAKVFSWQVFACLPGDVSPTAEMADEKL